MTEEFSDVFKVQFFIPDKKVWVWSVGDGGSLDGIDTVSVEKTLGVFRVWNSRADIEFSEYVTCRVQHIPFFGRALVCKEEE